MSNRLDNFEKNINDTLSQLEVEFNPDHWSEMNTMLDSNRTTIDFHIEKWFISGIILSIIALTISFSSPKEKVAKHNANSKKELHKTSPTNNKDQGLNRVKNPLILKEKNTKVNANNSLEKNVQIIHENINTEENKNDIDSNEESFIKQSVDSPPSDNTIENLHEEAPQILISKDAYCLNEDITISTNTNLDILWDFGDGTTSNEKMSIHNFDQPGTYTITLRRNGQTVSKSIKIYPIPDIFFDYEPAESQDLNQEYSFRATNSLVENLTWKINDKIINNTSEELSVSMYKAGERTVTLIGENEFKCKSQFEKNVEIKKDYNLLAPNAFTPNGDGDLDFWIPKALEFNNVDFELNVFDRKGKLIFYSNSASNKWNGKDNNGSVYNHGDVFVWTCNFTNTKGEKQGVNGSITIIK